MGCLFPQAEDLARYWANIRKGVDAITEVPESHWRSRTTSTATRRPPTGPTPIAAASSTPVDFPLLDFGIAPNAIEATDTTQLLGLLVARQALDDAGYGDDRALDRDRVSVILGVTGTLELVIPLGARLGHPIWRRALEAAGVDERPPRTSSGGSPTPTSAGRRTRSPACSATSPPAGSPTASTCAAPTASSTPPAPARSGAVNLAMLELAAGRCDLAVTGGLDTFNDIFMYMCFSKTPALSPTGDARPFDAEADGTILGEGLGVLVLKRLADARRDGDRIYAVIRSIGTLERRQGPGGVCAERRGPGEGAAAGLRAGRDLARRRSSWSRPTAPGPRSATRPSWRRSRRFTAAARPEGAVVCAGLGQVAGRAHQGGRRGGGADQGRAGAAPQGLAADLKVRRPIERLAGGDSPFYLNTEARPWLPRAGTRAARPSAPSASAAATSTACSRKPSPRSRASTGTATCRSSPSRPTIAAEIARALRALDGLTRLGRDPGRRPRGAGARFDARPSLPAAAGRRARRRATGRRCRRGAERGWNRCRDPARARQAEPTAPGPATARGRSSSGTGPRPGPARHALPRPGVAVRRHAPRAGLPFPADAGGPRSGERGRRRTRRVRLLRSDLSADGVRRRRRASDQELALRDTRFAQPAIGAVSLGLLRILEDFGVRPDLVGGHSFGELTALCAAGRIDDRSLAMLAQRRGALMAELRRARRLRGDARGLRPARAGRRRCSASMRLDVVIANKNAPRQCVLSGPAAEIERGRRLLGDRGIATQLVPVSAAFHSRFVAARRDAVPARRSTRSNLRASAIPVFANATAEPYPDDPEPARDLLAGQLARPVEFVAQIEAMYRMGARTFLEVGPDAKLTGLVRRDPRRPRSSRPRRRSPRAEQPATCTIWPARSQPWPRWGMLLILLAGTKGITEPAAADKKPGLTVKICGANAPTEGTGCRRTATGAVRQPPARSRPSAELQAARPPRFSIVGGQRRDDVFAPSRDITPRSTGP